MKNDDLSNKTVIMYTKIQTLRVRGNRAGGSCCHRHEPEWCLTHTIWTIYKTKRHCKRNELKLKKPGFVAMNLDDALHMMKIVWNEEKRLERWRVRRRWTSFDWERECVEYLKMTTRKRGESVPDSWWGDGREWIEDCLHVRRWCILMPGIS